MHPKSVFLALFALVLAVSPLAPVSSPVVARQGGETYGVQAADMDRAADPRADFYRYANGGWLDRTTIPADRSSTGADTELTDRNIVLLLDLLRRSAANTNLAPGTDEWKAVRYYAQGTDLAARNAAGVAPITPAVALIDAVKDLPALHRLLIAGEFAGVTSPLGVGVAADLRDSGSYSAYLGGPSLGLPNRDYYTDEDDATLRAREAYIATTAKLLGYLGYDTAGAERASAAVYEFERVLAETTLTREEEQDLSLIYNPVPVGELGFRYPMLDWPAYLAELGLGNAGRVVVTEVKYLNALDGIMRRTELATIKDYLKVRLIWDSAGYLSDEIGATAFQFGAALSGQQQRQPIERRALSQVNGALGFAVGRLFVAETFPPEAKARIEELVEELRIAFRARLQANPWMSPEAKAVALEKLTNVRVKVGYPDRWRTYEAVEIADTYAATALNASNAAARRQLARFGLPVDRDEWNILPQTVNATYGALNNEITFPAAILQAPFFDYRADPASNFGAIGYVIGHEITHGFDLRGSQFDPNGNLMTWWSDRDRAEFRRLNDRVRDQFAAIEVLPGVRINGQITVTENVADLGGMQVAYDALQNYLAKNGDPGMIDGMTQAQRFFVAGATSWRSKIRDEALRTQVQSDNHAPDAVRGVQPSRNMDAFHEAFGIRPGDPMYLPPEQRVVIW